ncbi:MAG TPA: antitoxin [Acidimicrobiaceae bacterium]|nr:antitoxin [Acidimicrobiaceae bacterium]
MRTTIDIRPDLHARAQSVARDRRQTISQAINDLLEQALDGPPPAAAFGRSAAGLPTIRVGRVITADDVRALDDE